MIADTGDAAGVTKGAGTRGANGGDVAGVPWEANQAFFGALDDKNSILLAAACANDLGPGTTLPFLVLPWVAWAGRIVDLGPWKLRPLLALGLVACAGWAPGTVRGMLVLVLLAGGWPLPELFPLRRAIVIEYSRSLVIRQTSVFKNE